MKRILYYIQLPPPIYGVTKVNQQVFESEKINQGFIKHLIRINFSKKLSDLNKINIFKILLLFKFWIQAIYLFLFRRPDYMYYTLPPIGLGFYKEIPLILILKLFNVKPIYHLHGKGMETRVNTKFKIYLYKYVFSNSILIHLSEGLIESEFKNIPVTNTKFHSVPNGIETVLVDKIEKEKDHIDLLFLSNIQESKGFFLLLKVFEKILTFYPNIRLNIIGNFRDSPNEKKFNDFLNSGDYKESIIFWGAKYDNEKHSIISKCDVLVHPSYNDAFPLVILEAMQHGLAIIGSDQGAIPEIITQQIGEVFATGDEDELYQKIEAIISKPERLNQMQINSKKLFFSKYTLENFENRMVKIFQNLN